MVPLLKFTVTERERERKEKARKTEKQNIGVRNELFDSVVNFKDWGGILTSRN